MPRKIVSSLAFAVAVAVLAAGPLAGQDKAEMVDNPMYKGWSNFKVGTTVTVEEKTTFGDADKALAPAAGDIKVVNYRLVEVGPKQVIVLTTVVENNFLGTVESAPTRITYPAQVNKADFEAALHKVADKLADGKVTVLGKEMACKVASGVAKEGPDERTRKFSYTTDVPGGIAAQVSTLKRDGKVIAETVATVKAIELGK